jgi:hypothetical protein
MRKGTEKVMDYRDGQEVFPDGSKTLEEAHSVMKEVFAGGCPPMILARLSLGGGFSRVNFHAEDEACPLLA